MLLLMRSLDGCDAYSELCHASAINRTLVASIPQLTLMRFGSCFLAESFVGMVMISTAAQKPGVDTCYYTRTGINVQHFST